MTTTAFRIDLIVPCIGMKWLTQPKQNTHDDQDHRYLK